MASQDGFARRDFLKALGAAPALQVAGSAAAADGAPAAAFLPLDLTRYFNASATDSVRARSSSSASATA